MRLTGAGRTDPGRRRTNNEDALLVDDELGLWVVCDGVGGKRSGEIASQRAAEAVRGYVGEARAERAALEANASESAYAQAGALVERAIQRACDEVHRAGKEDPSRRGMSTTIVCALRVGPRVVVGHVGDSRAYLVRGGACWRLTEDHTIIAEQLKAGLVTEAQAAESTMKGVLTRSLGSHASVQVDRLVLDVVPGDVLVLCTDGLHGYLRDEQLAAFVAAHAPYDLPGALVAHANASGGQDNVTVVALACLAQKPDARSMLARARLDAIRSAPLLHTLAYKEQVALLSIGASHHVAAGTTVMRESEHGGEMFLVVQGRLSVSKAGARVAELGPGGLVGEMALVDYAPRSATVVATEPTELLSFSREAMIGLMRSDPALGMKILWSMLQGVSAKLRTSTEGLARA